MISDEMYDGCQFEGQIEVVKEEIERGRHGMYMDFQKKEIEKIPNQIVERIMPKILELKNKKNLFDSIG